MAEFKGNEACDSSGDEPPPLMSNDICKINNSKAQPESECCVVSESDEDGDEFDDMEDGSEEVWWKADGTKKCKDLFSGKMFFNAQQCLEYCRNIHGFNLKILKKRHNMDCFSFFRLVNYLRSQKPSPGLVMSLSSDTLWQDEKFLKPVEEDDPLLMIDIEEDIYDSVEDEEEEDVYNQDNKSKSVIIRRERSPSDKALHQPESSNSSTSGFEPNSSRAAEVSMEEYENMLQELKNLRSKLEERNKDFDTLLSDMDHMKVVTRNILLDNSSSTDASIANKEGHIKSVSSRKTEEDSGYAGSYAHFGIHHEMLSDKIRTQSYKDAVSHNEQSLRDKLILDLGCGTGILSMFCARHGNAKHVVGVDMSDIAHQAMDIVRENDLQDKITIIKGRLEDVNLKEKLNENFVVKTNAGQDVHFDVLISEWMGYFLLFEGMLDSVMSARERYLKQIDDTKSSSGFLIMPNRCTMHLVGVCDEERYTSTAGYFSDVYGFKMSCLRKPMITEASIEVIPQSKVVTTDAMIHELDIATCELKDTEFNKKFSFVAKADCNLTALGGYFDCFFEAPNIADWHNVSFTTGPFGQATHWKQTLFYLEEKLPIQCDQKICGTIKVTRPTKDVRALKVKITINGRRPQTFIVE